MRRQNITGLRMAYLRSQKKWTQDRLATKLQCAGVDISRLSVARIEYGILKVNDTILAGLQKVFRIPIVLLFPQEIQDLDADFTKHIANQSPAPAKKPRRKNSRRKCQKLTKKRPPI